MKPETGLGDYIRAMAALQPQDEKTKKGIAKLCGLQGLPEKPGKGKSYVTKKAVLQSAEDRHREYPDTFKIPSSEVRETTKVGWGATPIFTVEPENRGPGAE